MFYIFLLIVAALGIAVYLVFIFKLVPGAAEERLGVLEPLPDDIGKWRVDEDSALGKAALERNRKREERLYFEEGKGLFAQGRLVRQVRYRNLSNNAIEEIEPDEPVKRKRIRV
ncbi:MAG TPA: hypothetical protein VFK05_07960 [Polyangiaceae bacterium]|nr:hypothetical protein [Polyangiaceae bacterium]